MKAKVIDRLAHSGINGFSEDAAYEGTDFFWVADGASAIRNDTFAGYASYAMWFTHLFREQFEKIASPSVPFPELVKRCIDSIEQAFPLSDLDWYDKPNFTISALQIDQAYARLYTLGDCSLYLLKQDGTIDRIYDDRVDRFYSQTIRAAQMARSRGEDTAASVRRQMLENREARNREGGFWVVGYGGRYEQEFRTAACRMHDIKRILICSDGFNRIFKEFSLYTLSDLLTGTVTLGKAYETLYTYETTHGTDADFPCVKIHDDATALLIEFA